MVAYPPSIRYWWVPQTVPREDSATSRGQVQSLERLDGLEPTLWSLCAAHPWRCREAVDHVPAGRGRGRRHFRIRRSGRGRHCSGCWVEVGCPECWRTLGIKRAPRTASLRRWALWAVPWLIIGRKNYYYCLWSMSLSLAMEMEIMEWKKMDLLLLLPLSPAFFCSFAGWTTTVW